MKNNSIVVLVALLSFTLFMTPGSSYGAKSDQHGSIIDHSLIVQIEPDKKLLIVSDTMTIPGSRRDVLASKGLLLNAGMKVTTWEGAKVVAPETTEPCGDGVCKRYFLQLDPDSTQIGQFTAYYRGELQDKSNPIESKGVTLAGGTVWYPRLGDELLKFDMTVRLPEKWHSVSQGGQFKVGPPFQEFPGFAWSGWKNTKPTDYITLIAGPWFEYGQTMVDGTKLLAFFRRDDPALAKSYLDTSERYIELYRDLLGPYPYKKFAVVENYRQTGLGMPSFTLLGSKVLRLPFILHSSLPHEILHNWWGNGVFVDYAEGNWCEGLTAYLADYWLKERRSEGAAYRRNTLIGYGDFVTKTNDFPLVEFRSRHNKSSQAVGYGKGAFFFHQLRQSIGDSAFLAGLGHFYRQNRFKRASYDDFRISMSYASGQDLSELFTQWTRRTGAPTLALKRAVSKVDVDGSYKITVTLQQTQDTMPFKLLVPFTITQVGEPRPLVFWRSMAKSQQSFEFFTPLRPLRLDVDSSYDLFRTLDPEERPITLSRAFGAKRGLIIYPANSDKNAIEIYRNVAVSWNLGITPDDALSELPGRRAVWLFGKSNRFGPRLLNSLYRFDVGEGVQTKRIKVLGEWYDDRKEAIVLVGNNPNDDNYALVQIMARPDKFPQLIPILARKLPHYGQYSYLIFSAPDGINQLKGQWPATGSPLSVTFDNKGFSRTAKEPPQPRPSTPLAVPQAAGPTFTPDPDAEMPPQSMVPEAEDLSEEKLQPKQLKLPKFQKKPNRQNDLFQEPVRVPLSAI
jgi:aminopeptidase N